ncbi:6-O-methylguanine DNA methyltransferase [Stachybotrys elegans]|uniref:Methylated-DNA--protein-cysteine methyltransferase n=1 Tax=Stachybotrys elegans TaxID=80388 RepID=A0A8K0SRZ6_9HYPO|nr:6-O-methylguanine DNA methyltransferase [Stachybotrys elegans]
MAVTKNAKIPTIKRSRAAPPSTLAGKITTTMDRELALIAHSQRTAFEKRVWTALCQVPRGSFTTYGLLAAHLGTSPRAVGNALRRNPFAPAVPCHRVVATGGGLGGFKGSWLGRKEGEGITLEEKRTLLRGEGVKLDGLGERVVGTPWGAFA